MIPKIIHYCWFGGSEIPKEYQEYIAEWGEFHPDWEIIKWDESNFPVDNDYIKTALALGNWANASNYARFYVLREFGGVYLDVDVRIIKALDPFLDNSFFLGFESFIDSNNFWINNAVMGAVPNNMLVAKATKELIESFNGDEEADQSAPKLITNLLKKECPEIQAAGYFNDSISIYPPETFYPILYNERYKLKDANRYVSESTYTIHDWGRTWFTIDKCLNIIDELEFQVKELNLKLASDRSTQANSNLELNPVQSGNPNFLIKTINLLKEENLLQAEINFIEAAYKQKLEDKDNTIQKLSSQLSNLVEANLKLSELLFRDNKDK